MFKVIKDFLEKHPLLKSRALCLALGIFVTIVSEIIARKSLTSFFDFFKSGFVPFLYNCAIVVLTFCIARLFKRRTFAYTLVSVFWIGLACINAVLQFLRPSPLTAADFIMFLSAYEITTSYLSTLQIVGLILLCAAIIAAMVILFRKTCKKKPAYKTELVFVGVTAALFVAFSVAGNVSGALRIDFNNIGEAYESYGFEYCFCSTAFRKGVNKPAEYSDQAVRDIISKLNGMSETKKGKIEDGELPNIIFVQLESFFDLSYYNEYEMSEDATPNFTALKSKYPNGILQVPVFGGGTANTEFEVLTGMRIAYFSGGEIPFETVLKKGSCESLPYNLEKYGYTSTALHNHTGTFYGRNEVYANLGFDRFVSSEYMQGLEYTPVGWEKDTVLTEYIMESMKTTEGKDFIFTVSVQGHGGYLKEDEGHFLPLTLKNDDGSEQAYSVRYYANQLYEMDNFIGELVVALEEFDEETVVVFYGDHLPALNLSNENLDVLGTYQTEYLVYSNFDYDFEAPEGVLLCNRLASETLKPLELSGGYIMNLNSSMPDSTDYRSSLNILQYEMLYGEQFAEMRSREPKEMTMGIYPVVIDEVSFDGERLYVFCSNSTYNSVIYVNGKRCFTKYYSETYIVTDEADNIKPGDVITVCQENSNGDVLGTSAPVMFK